MSNYYYIEQTKDTMVQEILRYTYIVKKYSNDTQSLIKGTKQHLRYDQEPCCYVKCQYNDMNNINEVKDNCTKLNTVHIGMYIYMLK